MSPDGVTRPASGVLTAFEVPSGAGYRTDSFGYVGYRTSTSFDSLLAKVIVHTPSGRLPDALAKAARALAEFRIEGVATNAGFLQSILAHPEVVAGTATTRFVDDHLPELVAGAAEPERLYFAADSGPANGPRLAGVKLDSADPLAVLDYGRAAVAPKAGPDAPDAHDGPAGTTAVPSPLQGTVVQIAVTEGEPVRAGQQLLVCRSCADPRNDPPDLGCRGRRGCRRP
jgi:acetyl/propionyl-CoA carboxylase alpha subunit